MNDTNPDKSLIDASKELITNIGSAVNVIDVKIAQSLGLSGITQKRYQEFEESIREQATATISELEDNLHRFADVSEPYTLDLYPEPPRPEDWTYQTMWCDPMRLIGTSAHHAGVMFLHHCLGYDFLEKLPSVRANWLVIRHRIDIPLFMTRIKWERMKAFKTSDFSKNNDYEHIIEINGSQLKQGFHSPTEDIPSMFSYEKGDPSCRLRGNQTQLAHALNTTPHIFKTWANARSIWVIQHTPNDLEVLVHKLDRHKIEEYRERLAEYEPSPPKKKTSRKRKQK